MIVRMLISIVTDGDFANSAQSTSVDGPDIAIVEKNMPTKNLPSINTPAHVHHIVCTWAGNETSILG